MQAIVGKKKLVHARLSMAQDLKNPMAPKPACLLLNLLLNYKRKLMLGINYCTVNVKNRLVILED